MSVARNYRRDADGLTFIQAEIWRAFLRLWASGHPPTLDEIAVAAAARLGRRVDHGVVSTTLGVLADRGMAEKTPGRFRAWRPVGVGGVTELRQVAGETVGALRAISKETAVLTDRKLADLICRRLERIARRLELASLGENPAGGPR